MTERTKESLTLTPRLQAIADRVPEGARLADVGTDHGHLPLYLLRENRIESAIACDLRESPLNHARDNARAHKLDQRICFRLACGLDAVDEQECDVISIAGMGGETIASILQAAAWTARGNHRLLLQPMTMLAQLRQWLWAHGYCIEEETVCREGARYYLVWMVRGGAQSIEKPLAQCYVSQALLSAQGAEAYLSALLTRERSVLRGMERGRKTDPILLRTQHSIVHEIETALEE